LNTLFVKSAFPTLSSFFYLRAIVIAAHEALAEAKKERSELMEKKALFQAEFVSCKQRLDEVTKASAKLMEIELVGQHPVPTYFAAP
jgi:predicted nuclease with TOPRIM domain